MKQIILDYQTRRFNVTTTFGDGVFEHLTYWRRTGLHINLTTCAVDSHAPKAENAIRFLKKRLRSVQYETPF